MTHHLLAEITLSLIAAQPLWVIRAIRGRSDNRLENCNHSGSQSSTMSEKLLIDRLIVKP